MFDAAVILGTVVTNLGTVLAAVAPIAAGLGASVLGLRFGWNLVRSFIH